MSALPPRFFLLPMSHHYPAPPPDVATRKRTRSISVAADGTMDLEIRDPPTKKFRQEPKRIEIPGYNDDRMDVDIVTPGELGTRLGNLEVAQHQGGGVQAFVPEQAVPAAENQGGKKKLKMGYMASCQRCRDRVPGHWAHYV